MLFRSNPRPPAKNPAEQHIGCSLHIYQIHIALIEILRFAQNDRFVQISRQALMKFCAAINVTSPIVCILQFTICKKQAVLLLLTLCIKIFIISIRFEHLSAHKADCVRFCFEGMRNVVYDLSDSDYCCGKHGI